jgi:hypothetical protein
MVVDSAGNQPPPLEPYNEKQGGSDVRANTTTAQAVNGGGPGSEHELVGHKIGRMPRANSSSAGSVRRHAVTKLAFDLTCGRLASLSKVFEVGERLAVGHRAPRTLFEEML